MGINTYSRYNLLRDIYTGEVQAKPTYVTVPPHTHTHTQQLTTTIQMLREALASKNPASVNASCVMRRSAIAQR